MNKIVLRKEITTNKMIDRNKLIRIVKNNKNEIFVDTEYIYYGRSAYIFYDLNSLEIAKKKNLLSKSLRSKINDDIYEKIKEIINAKTKII